MRQRVAWVVSAGVLAGLAVSLVSLSAAVAQRPEADAETGRIADYLGELSEVHDIPGLAVAVIDEDGAVHEHVQGSDGDGRAITRDSPFLIGSIARRPPPAWWSSW